MTLFISMKPLYILKLGGSVITYKNRTGGKIRKKLIKKIAKKIKDIYSKGGFNIILVHGAGSIGHQLAHKYQLSKGANQTKDGWHGSLISRIANQETNLTIAKIFVNADLPVTSIHTSSIVVQSNKLISDFYLTSIKESLKQNCIPLLYGEMVLDQTLGMTICSGDFIVPYLAQKLGAKKIFFASDIDGVFDYDPHLNKRAKLIKRLSLNKGNAKAKIGASHSTDVTGGLLGKLTQLESIKNSAIQSIEIFNGLKEDNYQKILLGKPVDHTTIRLN